MSLAILADVLKAPLVGADAVFTGVSTDTRALKAGELFVAITGPHHDGHSFLSEAIAAGAAGAGLGRAGENTPPHVSLADTLRTL